MIDVATTLLDSGGVDAVTLREVGHRSGVSHNAPYKHFADKEALLAAVAARELRRLSEMQAGIGAATGSVDAVRLLLHGYIEWALAHPARFKLVFSSWSVASDELADEARTGWSGLVDVVAAAQRSGSLPPGDPERMASLLRSLTHGAVDLALSGHLAADGKGGAEPATLVDDLLGHLAAAVPAPA
ncbi:TetR/AcrR family transcriptional regulator [Pseudonocardia alaniniphila]